MKWALKGVETHHLKKGGIISVKTFINIYLVNKKNGSYTTKKAKGLQNTSRSQEDSKILNYFSYISSTQSIVLEQSASQNTTAKIN